MKKYTYVKNINESFDAEFAAAARVYRRVEYVYGKICCGGDTYDIQQLV